MLIHDSQLSAGSTLLPSSVLMMLMQTALFDINKIVAVQASQSWMAAWLFLQATVYVREHGNTAWVLGAWHSCVLVSSQMKPQNLCQILWETGVPTHHFLLWWATWSEEMEPKNKCNQWANEAGEGDVSKFPGCRHTWLDEQVLTEQLQSFSSEQCYVDKSFIFSRIFCQPVLQLANYSRRELYFTLFFRVIILSYSWFICTNKLISFLKLDSNSPKWNKVSHTASMDPIEASCHGNSGGFF